MFSGLHTINSQQHYITVQYSTVLLMNDENIPSHTSNSHQSSCCCCCCCSSFSYSRSHHFTTVVMFTSMIKR